MAGRSGGDATLGGGDDGAARGAEPTSAAAQRARSPIRRSASPSRRRGSTRRAAPSSPASAPRAYDFSRAPSSNIPQGENAPLNQVLLRAPGVVQDSFGQIHVRGDHGNVQYRLDGVQLPEGLSLFNNILATRYADQMSLITGALPAQYGLQTAGIVDITLKSGTTDPGAEVSITGGSRDYAAARLLLWRPHRHDRLFRHRPVHPQRHRHREPDLVVHADPRRHRPVVRAGQDHRHRRRADTRLSFIAGGAKLALPDPQRSLPDAELHRQRRNRLEQRHSRPAPVGEDLLRHRLAAEELRGRSTSSSRASPATRACPTSPIRSATWCSTASRRGPSGPASPPACRATAAGRSPTTTRCAAASWCSASAPPASPTAIPCRWCRAIRRPDERSDPVRPALRLHRRLRPHRLDLQRLPAGRMAGRAHRHGEFRPAFRRHQRRHPGEPAEPAHQRRVAAQSTFYRPHAGYSRYFTPPPLVQVNASSIAAAGRHGRRARSDDQRSR